MTRSINLDQNGLRRAEKAYMQASTAGVYSVALNVAILAYLEEHAEWNRALEMAAQIVDTHARVAKFQECEEAARQIRHHKVEATP